MMIMFILFTCILSTQLIAISLCNQDFCYADSGCIDNNVVKPKNRFLLYDVNHSEGFNLRRDVYMRFAVLAHKLKNSKDNKLNNFNLVLPPWSRLVHWQYSPVPEHIPWGMFFDLDSLKAFAPVIEMHEFFTAVHQKIHDKIVIDEVYVLQHFEDMFETGNFQERMEVDNCAENIQLNYFFYKNITSRVVKCLSYHGPATKLDALLSKSSAKVILIHHAEVSLHEMFGNRLYWQSRRSMRFNKQLRRIAAQFRQQFLQSTDESDNTTLVENWKDEQAKRNAKGGPYLAVHLRRRDFLRGRSHQVPFLDDVAEQITKSLKKLSLVNVFIATDAENEEYEKLIEKIPPSYTIFKYVPSDEVQAKFRDGGVAIIDQIICSHARFFIGTRESTFSFRIQEEREILGFPVKTTFNSFCRKNAECSQPSVWKIVY